jgi:predicted NAD-dependent protein-ADP-ribosyltransferase YbiA (DUF1768 family)
MGGPCILIDEEGKETTAPPCTDNFQVRPFFFDGQEWQSVEQCFQGLKFLDLEMREQIRSIKKEPDQSDAGHGLSVWQAGQARAQIRPDWDATKVEIMYLVNFAKYSQNKDLQDELLQTGTAEIAGGPSTSWTTRSGRKVNWSEWNGRVQMLIRELLRHPADQNVSLAQELQASFQEYLDDQGGAALPLPGWNSKCEIGEVSEAQAKIWMETCAHATCINSSGQQWNAWAGADAVGGRAIIDSLLKYGLDDGKLSGIVAGVLEGLIYSEQGVSVSMVEESLAEYDDEVLEDVALDNPNATDLVARVRAAVAKKSNGTSDELSEGKDAKP